MGSDKLVATFTVFRLRWLRILGHPIIYTSTFRWKMNVGASMLNRDALVEYSCMPADGHTHCTFPGLRSMLNGQFTRGDSFPSRRVGNVAGHFFLLRRLRVEASSRTDSDLLEHAAPSLAK